MTWLHPGWASWAWCNKNIRRSKNAEESQNHVAKNKEIRKKKK
jgi:hypothetical protein